MSLDVNRRTGHKQETNNETAPTPQVESHWNFIFILIEQPIEQHNTRERMKQEICSDAIEENFFATKEAERSPLGCQ